MHKKPKNNMPIPGGNDLSHASLAMIVDFFKKKCRHLYFHTKESFGQPKREIIVNRVEEACDSLEETKAHFEDALVRFRSVIEVREDSLEKRYRQLKMQFEISETKAYSVRDNIRLIEDVSEALFAEWEEELELYKDRGLKAQSRRQLKQTRQQYARLIKAMHKAESKITPVLSAFRDQVLFLKHNLNAQAIASLHNELVEISVDISQLIHAMEYSIDEANKFVSNLMEPPTLLKNDR